MTREFSEGKNGIFINRGPDTSKETYSQMQNSKEKENIVP